MDSPAFKSPMLDNLSELGLNNEFIGDSSTTGIFTPEGSTTSSQFNVSYGPANFALSIPNLLHPHVLQLKDNFLLTLEQSSEAGRWQGNDVLAEGELLLRFMAFVEDEIERREAERDSSVNLNVLERLLEVFEARVLQGNDIHVSLATWEVSLPNKYAAIQSYLRARAILRRPVQPPRSTLVTAALSGKARIFAIFGGQGNDEHYFEELRTIYSTYYTIVHDFINSADVLLNQLWTDERYAEQYPYGLHLLKWLNDPTSVPDTSYLVSAPVSFPLIGLLQLLHYKIVCHTLGLNPQEMQKLIQGTTGHSQGIITAAVIALSDSWSKFDKLSVDALIILQSIGARSQQFVPTSLLAPEIIASAEENGEGRPTPMLSIRYLSLDKIQELIRETNNHLGSQPVEVSLVNSRNNVVVSGPPLSLYALTLKLRAMKGLIGTNQARIIYTERKPSFSFRYLPIMAPFHSSYLTEAVALVIQDMRNIVMPGIRFKIPVYDTTNGTDLRQSAGNIVPDLVRMIMQEQLRWEKACSFVNPTTIIDFGPGGTEGVGSLTNKNKEGTGVRVILASVLEGSNRDFGYIPELFREQVTGRECVIKETWKERFAPRLVKTFSTGETIMDTKMSRLLGLPPFMVAGMTPTTVSAEFVIATMNSGYHIELASGGYHTAEALTQAVHNIANNITPGRGITINIIYASPHAVRWQIPTILKLRAEGSPIDGLTIGAGVPSIEIAGGYIQDLGLRHISFKPGSAAAIQLVVDIAQAYPTFPIILQWTGGRGGGHHSFEDFHQPILEAYSRIRNCENITLVAGSGFGSIDDSYPYLTGDWATKFGYPHMPFDGILLGSRVMVAKEARTSPAAKQAIVDAPGVGDQHWVQTYQKPTGGVLTVMSEMGEPIHKLATRGVQLWSEFDRTLFKLKKPELAVQLQQKRDYIISRLNKDFQKVWFGRDSTGAAVDLDDMTYSEVLTRLVDLTYVPHECRWINSSYKKLLHDFMVATEARFVGTASQLVQSVKLSELDQPYEMIRRFQSRLPATTDRLLTFQDAQNFIAMCRRRGQKPVPFIPVLDESFEVWFKKDSLWQSEDLEAVQDQDVGRVCILQGPVAVQYSKIVDESVQSIMDGLHVGAISRLLNDHYDGRETAVPVSGCFGLVPTKSPEPAGIEVRFLDEQETKVIYEISAEASVIDLDSWLKCIGGPENDWRCAFFTTKWIVQDSRICENPVRRLFAPNRDSYVMVGESEESYVPSISLFEQLDVDCSRHAVEVRLLEDSIIELVIMDERNTMHSPTGLHLRFTYHPECPFAPIREVMVDRNERIKDFYHRVWFGTAKSLVHPSSDNVFRSGQFQVTSDWITKFSQCINNSNDAFTKQSNKQLYAPMDFAIVVGWRAVIVTLFAEDIDADLLKLVHLSNGFKMIEGAQPIKEGDHLETESRITAVINQDSGKLVKVIGQVFREGQPIVDLASEFLVRGRHTDYDMTFEKITEPPMEIELKNAKDVAVLKTKKWFQLNDHATDFVGRKLFFNINTVNHFDENRRLREVTSVGEVKLQVSSQETALVGYVNYSAKLSSGNPVMEYLQRRGQETERRMMFDNPVPLHKDPLVVKVPASNELYAHISGDYNSIHVSKALARYVELPGTITHGMYTSARARGLLERYVCAADISLFRGFQCSFLGMVLPNDELEVSFQHTGMLKGCKIIQVKVTKKGTSDVVLQGEAQIDTPSTGYIFTGQGSQYKGMGMDLYAESEAARRVWDFADEHLLEEYGFRITDIVKNNPKELIINFGGVRGRRLRSNYMSLMCDVTKPNATITRQPIFPTIDEDTDSYRYYSPEGLLNATQFTQPALALMERALFEDLEARGLVSDTSSFAGHSLGEYGAVSSVAKVIPFKNLVSLLFYRGLSMQVAVTRDAEGRSNYAMCAIDPSRAAAGFDEKAMLLVVRLISLQTGGLLEIVNYNVANMQYVCAGELQAIDCLTTVLDTLKAQKTNIRSLLSTLSMEEVELRLVEVITASRKNGSERPELKRGTCTIPLPGIDVPFHSSYLKPGVTSFRDALRRNIARQNVNADRLVGKYIPNLTGEPFEISKEYFEKVYALTGSEVASQIVQQWDMWLDEKQGLELLGERDAVMVN